MLLDPLDEHPIHQVPMSMAYVATSDRNVYDRCIYQGQDHEAETFFLTGLGVYPNAGIVDAFMSVRRGGRQWSLQTSGPFSCISGTGATPPTPSFPLLTEFHDTFT